jgi:hypothetical protein
LSGSSGSLLLGGSGGGSLDALARGSLLGDDDLLQVGVDGLLDAFSALLVSDGVGVEEAGAANLELGGSGLDGALLGGGASDGGSLGGLLDLEVASILAGADLQEFLEVLDFTRHFKKRRFLCFISLSLQKHFFSFLNLQFFFETVGHIVFSRRF